MRTNDIAWVSMRCLRDEFCGCSNASAPVLWCLPCYSCASQQRQSPGSIDVGPHIPTARAAMSGLFCPQELLRVVYLSCSFAGVYSECRAKPKSAAIRFLNAPGTLQKPRKNLRSALGAFHFQKGRNCRQTVDEESRPRGQGRPNHIGYSPPCHEKSPVTGVTL